MSSAPRETVERRIDEVTRLLGRQQVLSSLASRGASHRQDIVEQLQERQNLAELQRYLRTLHPADVALVLESLPLDDRLLVFRQLAPADAALALVEMSHATASSLVDDIAPDELLAALETLEADDLASLSDVVPPEVLEAVTRTLEQQERTWLADSLSYDESSVGRLMTPDAVTVIDDRTVGQLLEELRARGEWPEQTDRVFVVDGRRLLRGAVPLQALVRGEPEVLVKDLMVSDAALATFSPEEPAANAAKAFERYDLVSAPVVDVRGRLLGRVRIDNVMDYVRESSEHEALARAGLRETEDLFASVKDAVSNRWPWLCLNLVTAFAASRVIAQFEQTIAKAAVLAALMPIVASVGGNTGNQTVALVIRALAFEQFRDQYRQLVRKELSVSLVSGLTWGTVMGLAAFAMYRDWPLALVMTAAVVLNLLVAGATGIAVPVALHRAGRDPAQGSSVVLTFVTDSMGFFLFLGLATLFLP